MINYADPTVAAGTAVLGLGLVVLPLLSRLDWRFALLFSFFCCFLLMFYGCLLVFIGFSIDFPWFLLVFYGF